MGTQIAAADWVPVALLLRPQGRRGEVLADPLSDLAEVFTAGSEMALTRVGSQARTVAGEHDVMVTIESHWFPTGKNAGRVVLKLVGYDSITAAEALAGHDLRVLSSNMPVLDADTFFVGDLLGCEFYDGDTLAGAIVDVQFATGPDGRTRLPDAAPLLGIRLLGSSGTADDEPVLVPFVRAWLESVDLAGRRVVMHLPAGLLGTDSGDALGDDGDAADRSQAAE